MRSSLERLPLDRRGYRIPWFVTGQTAKGDPDFIHISPLRIVTANTKGLCWICGGGMGRTKRSFVFGPMSLFGRICVEPPMHLDCARYAVQTCPFMVNPKRRRADTDLSDSPGLGLERNPGISLIYTANSFKVRYEDGAAVYTLGSPASIEAWREGRRATMEEFRESLRTGLAELEKRMPLDAQFYGLVPGVLALGEAATIG